METSSPYRVARERSDPKTRSGGRAVSRPRGRPSDGRERNRDVNAANAYREGRTGECTKRNRGRGTPSRCALSPVGDEVGPEPPGRRGPGCDRRTMVRLEGRSVLIRRLVLRIDQAIGRTENES
jgi:hypothetical protein